MNIEPDRTVADLFADSERRGDDVVSLSPAELLDLHVHEVILPHHKYSVMQWRGAMLVECRPSQDLFEHLAVTSPARLRAFINDETLTPGMRARAAEAAACLRDADLAARMLLPLLGSAPPIVQEGAVYALEKHISNASVRMRLAELVGSPDTSDGVREAAREALEEV